jgi:hypothetical protein
VNRKGEREAKRKKGEEEEERTNILPRDSTQKCKCTPHRELQKKATGIHQRGVKNSKPKI